MRTVKKSKGSDGGKAEEIDRLLEYFCSHNLSWSKVTEHALEGPLIDRGGENGSQILTDLKKAATERDSASLEKILCKCMANPVIWAILWGAVRLEACKSENGRQDFSDSKPSGGREQAVTPKGATAVRPTSSRPPAPAKNQSTADGYPRRAPTSPKELREIYEGNDDGLSPRDRKKQTWGSVPTPEENEAILVRIRRRLRAIEKADRTDWAAVFAKVDSSGDGSLSCHEFRKMVRGELLVGQNDMREKELIMVFEHIDVDGGGEIEAEEFIDFVNSGRGVGECEDEARKQIGRDKAAQKETLRNQKLQARLSSEEVRSWQEKTDEEKQDLVNRVRKRLKSLEKHDGVDWMKMFAKCDSSGEGQVDIREFRGLIRRELLIGQREMSAQDCSIVFNCIDKDGGGSIEAEEFIAFVQGGEDGEQKDQYIPTSKRSKTPKPRPWELAYGDLSPKSWHPKPELT